MRASGRAAALPEKGWQPAERREGARVLFVSEDGTQRKVFDFGRLPVSEEIRDQIAEAFEAATGPLGTWKRQKGAANLHYVASLITRWLASTRPGMRSLTQLSGADARMLALSFTEGRLLGIARSLLSYSSQVSQDVNDELARHHIKRAQNARQPYMDAELARICTIARAIVRRARDRIWEHRSLVDEFRAGRFDSLDERDGLRCFAAALEHCERTGDIPRSALTGRPAMVARRAMRYASGASLMNRLYPTASEAWAFAVLLVASSGLNASVIDTLPAPHLQATTEAQPGIALVETNKPRRGSRARATLPLSAVPDQMRPSVDRPLRVQNTSLTSAFGVFSLLIDLTEPARRHLGSNRALVYFRGLGATDGDSHFAHGLPQYPINQRRCWLRPWLTGDRESDDLLTGISLDRLRKTRIEAARRPIAHTPATYARYLRRMRKVTEEGFEIVRDALDEQVARALARRKMEVITDPDAVGEDDGPTRDTVLGNCADFQHSPLDGGRPCRQNFLTCLDCRNARAFPRHVPAQLAVRDGLLALRPGVSAERWAAEYAGRVAQLDDILTVYTDAQRQAARAQITDDQRRVVARLFHGDLDPL